MLGQEVKQEEKVVYIEKTPVKKVEPEAPKPLENPVESMFEYAKYVEGDTQKVFDWVLASNTDVEQKMRLWGTYVEQITAYQVAEAVRNEDKLKLLRILS